MHAQANTASATLQIELDHVPPVGALTGAEGQRRTFNGWIELASVIEDWRRSVKQPETRRPASNVAGEQPHNAQPR